MTKRITKNTTLRVVDLVRLVSFKLREIMMGELIHFTKKEDKCSFCKREKKDVPVMVGSDDNPKICSICVAKCMKLLNDNEN